MSHRVMYFMKRGPEEEKSRKKKSAFLVSVVVVNHVYFGVEIGWVGKENGERGTVHIVGCCLALDNANWPKAWSLNLWNRNIAC